MEMDLLRMENRVTVGHPWLVNFFFAILLWARVFMLV